MNVMQQALDQSDATLLRRSAHSLKASSAMLGAPRLAELCGQLDEALCEVSILTQEGIQVAEIEIEFQQVQAGLSAERQRCHSEELGESE
ncbi:MAG: Hpt domain-containing protein [Leptolyngbyaceae cyanobacterium CRU_2_3]|nr:Hpt domain-containing protein [Leptolyngbyaceae cyanobacterium CRU_2_3]